MIDREEEKEYCYSEYSQTSIHAYRAILEICRRIGITEVHDIGCGFAFQSQMFADNNIMYLGIESDSGIEPYVVKGRNISYISSMRRCIPLINTARISSAGRSTYCSFGYGAHHQCLIKRRTPYFAR